MLLHADALIRKDQHRIPGESFADLREHVVGQRAGQVDVANFVRVETDKMFAALSPKGRVNRFAHRRAPASVGNVSARRRRP